MSLGAFHLRNHNRSLFDLGRVVVKKRRHFPNSAGGVYQDNRNSQMAPLSARPLTIFGLIPTPQVSMGACFFNILHNCNYQVSEEISVIIVINKICLLLNLTDYN